MNEVYKQQVRLLLDVLPEAAKEDCFAMHGGTAINLFVRNMPRLSVDIDLTYVEILERKETLEVINAALLRIKKHIEGLRPSIRVQHKANTCKLRIDEQGVIIKIEVNMVSRGLLGGITKAQLCDAAQEQFDAFCVVPVVPMAQLYGGKICAALDRQHPRDLFDVKLLLDQKTAFDNQFTGMSAIPFSYDEYESTRLKLIERIKADFTESDKAFLLGVNRLAPDWLIYDYQDFPSVKWKVLNLEKFKKESPKSYQQHLNELETILAQ